VPAITAIATPACAARVDTVLSTSAPPELLPDDLAELPVLAGPSESVGVPEVVLVVPDGTTARGCWHLGCSMVSQRRVYLTRQQKNLHWRRAPQSCHSSCHQGNRTGVVWPWMGQRGHQCPREWPDRWTGLYLAQVQLHPTHRRWQIDQSKERESHRTRIGGNK